MKPLITVDFFVSFWRPAQEPHTRALCYAISLHHTSVFQLQTSRHPHRWHLDLPSSLGICLSITQQHRESSETRYKLPYARYQTPVPRSLRKVPLQRKTTSFAESCRHHRSCCKTLNSWTRTQSHDNNGTSRARHQASFSQNNLLCFFERSLLSYIWELSRQSTRVVHKI